MKKVGNHFAYSGAPQVIHNAKLPPIGPVCGVCPRSRRGRFVQWSLRFAFGKGPPRRQSRTGDPCAGSKWPNRNPAESHARSDRYVAMSNSLSAPLWLLLPFVQRDHVSVGISNTDHPARRKI